MSHVLCDVDGFVGNSSSRRWQTWLHAAACTCLKGLRGVLFVALAAGGALAVPGAVDQALGQATCSMSSGIADAPGANAFACGPSAFAPGTDATAIGYAAEARGQGDTSIGVLAGESSLGNENTRVGFGAGAVGSGDRNVAVGVEAGLWVFGSNNVAVGYRAGAGTFDDPLTVSNATAIGNAALASHSGATAIGAGATTTRANQVMLGTATNTYTLAGIASAGSAAAQSGELYLVTSDSAGNLATTSFNPAAVTGLAADVASLEGSVATLQRDMDKAFEGTAMALAMAGAVLPEGKNFALSASWGTFEGEHGFAGSAALRINENVHLHGGLGLGANHGTVGGRAGVTVAW